MALVSARLCMRIVTEPSKDVLVDSGEVLFTGSSVTVLTLNLHGLYNGSRDQNSNRKRNQYRLDGTEARHKFRNV